MPATPMPPSPSALEACASPPLEASAKESGTQAPAGNHGHPPRQRLRSAQLLGPAQSVEIEHLGQIYRLHATRAGKLILTK